MAPKRLIPRVPSNEREDHPHRPRAQRRGGHDEAHRLALLYETRDRLAAMNPPEELRRTWFAWHHGLTGPPDEAFDGHGNFTPAAKAAMSRPGHAANPANSPHEAERRAPAPAPGRNAAPPPPPPPPPRRNREGQVSASSMQPAPGPAVDAAPAPAEATLPPPASLQRGF